MTGRTFKASSSASLGESGQVLFPTLYNAVRTEKGERNDSMVPNPPADMPRVTPHLFYDNVGAAIDWLSTAFGFPVRLRMTDDKGMVVHGELEIGPESLVMLGLTEENPAWTSPQTFEGKG